MYCNRKLLLCNVSTLAKEVHDPSYARLAFSKMSRMPAETPHEVAGVVVHTPTTSGLGRAGDGVNMPKWEG